MTLASFWHRLVHPNALSLDWLREQDRKETRVHFEGAAFQAEVKRRHQCVLNSRNPSDRSLSKVI